MGIGSWPLGIRLSAVLLVSMALAASCRRAPSGPIELAVPGRTGAHVTLAADGDRVAAVWAATGSDRVTDIYLATSDDAGRTFAPPVRVNDIDGDVSAGGEQPPRVILKGSAVDVVWVSKRAGVARHSRGGFDRRRPHLRSRAFDHAGRRDGRARMGIRVARRGRHRPCRVARRTQSCPAFALER